MIGTRELLVIDCQEPQRLARFYAELIGAEIGGDDADWTEIVPPGGGRPIIAFQQVEQYLDPAGHPFCLIKPQS